MVTSPCFQWVPRPRGVYCSDTSWLRSNDRTLFMSIAIKFTKVLNLQLEDARPHARILQVCHADAACTHDHIRCFRLRVKLFIQGWKLSIWSSARFIDSCSKLCTSSTRAAWAALVRVVDFLIFLSAFPLLVGWNGPFGPLQQVRASWSYHQLPATFCLSSKISSFHFTHMTFFEASFSPTFRPTVLTFTRFSYPFQQGPADSLISSPILQIFKRYIIIKTILKSNPNYKVFFFLLL